MNSSRSLGTILLAPALVIIVLFFFGPVAFTTFFSFTNMSTATGISSAAAYHIDPNALQKLRDTYAMPDLAEKLASSTYEINEATLGAMAEAGVNKDTVAELRADHMGESFNTRRDAERMIKDLGARPHSIRDIKTISEAMNQSLANARFPSQEALLTRFGELGFNLSAEQQAAVLDSSYTGWKGTLANFERMVRSPNTKNYLINTAFYLVTTMAIFNTTFALVLAITTFYMPEGSAGFFRSLWLLPRVTPPVIYVLMWKWFAWDNGFLSMLLAPFGVHSRNWMLDTSVNAWVFVILINGFIGASMGMIIFSSAIRAIPRTLLYASEVDGANRWQQIRHIILPQLKWPILFITTYQSLSLLTSFDYILLSTDGGPGTSTEVWALAVYHTALNAYSGNLQYGYGSAMALVLVVVGIALSLAYLRLFDFRTLVGSPRIEA